MDKIILIIQIRFLKSPFVFTFLPLHAFHARGRSQRGERRSDDACQHLEGQPPYLLVLHYLPPFFSNVPLIVFFSPAEIKEIAEMSPSENVVENLMRSQKFPLFLLFLRDFDN